MAKSKARRPARAAAAVKTRKPAAKAKKPVRKVAKKPEKKPAKRPAARAPAPAPVVARPAPAAPAKPAELTLRVNGAEHRFLLGRDVTPSMTLSYVLREKLGLTGVKVSCDEGGCGACTVLYDGRAVLSCMMLAVEAQGHDVLTVEGLPKDDPVVDAFAKQSEPGHGSALQCGMCTPGFVMAAHGLLRENPHPTVAEAKEALSGNLCRCGCYPGILKAVVHASEAIAERGGVK